MVEFIKNLQNKPEKEKIKILRLAVVITVLVLIGVWILTLKFRSLEKGDTSGFQKIWMNLKDLKSSFSNGQR